MNVTPLPPRPQAVELVRSTPLSLVLNMSLREEVLVEKCMGEDGGGWVIRRFGLGWGWERRWDFRQQVVGSRGCGYAT